MKLLYVSSVSATFELENQEIYYCTKYGVKHHMEKTNNTKAFYKEHLYGKAYFVYMVEPEIGKSMLKNLDGIQWDY